MPIHSASVEAASPVLGPLRCDSRWLMAYSAATGATAPALFDTRSAVIAHPLFSVAPEWALLTASADPFALGLSRDELQRNVHATHRLQIHRSLREGDEIVVKARLVGAESIRSGTLTTVRFESTTVAGEPLWTTWMGSIYRDVELIGGDVPAPLPPARSTVEQHGAVEETVVGKQVAAGEAHIYTECARIWNPIHTDVAVAEQAGLPGIILHGTASLAYAVTAAMQWCNATPDSVVEVAGSFRAMVPMPSALEIVMRREPLGVCWFDVRIDGAHAVRDGYVVFR